MSKIWQGQCNLADRPGPVGFSPAEEISADCTEEYYDPTININTEAPPAHPPMIQEIHIQTIQRIQPGHVATPTRRRTQTRPSQLSQETVGEQNAPYAHGIGKLEAVLAGMSVMYSSSTVG